MSGELIVSRYVAESIVTDAGRFGHIGLCQLHTNCHYVMHNLRICVQIVRSWQRSTWLKRPASVAIDCATYLLTISSPNIDNVAMSLYDIVHI